jgi:C4-dicarboxylate transporter DctM subunit
MEGLIIFGGMFVLFFLGIPIGFSLFIISLLAFALFTETPLIALGVALMGKLDSYPLLCVVFFIFAGNLMLRGKTSERLIEFTTSLLGYIPGGLGIVAVFACALFGAISGSATATLVAIGGIMMPAMIEHGYSEKCSIGLMTNSGMLGIVMPPSVPMIIYALLAGTSVGKVFAAGFLPCILIVFIFSIYVLIIAHRERYPSLDFVGIKPYLKKFAVSSYRSLPALSIPAVIFIGIFGGIFSATEAGAIAVIMAFVIEYFFFRGVTLREVWETMIDSFATTASFLIIVAAASTFGDYLTLEQIPVLLTEKAMSYIHSPLVFLIFINIAFLICGMFLDVLSAIILLTPIVIPIVEGFGIDPVHFGVVVVVNLGIGYVTPPVGINLFVTTSIMKRNLQEVIAASFPYFLLSMIALMIITYWPALSLLIPRLIYGH